MLRSFKTPLKRTVFLSAILLVTVFAGCQKGLDYELPPEEYPGNNGGGGGDTDGGNTTPGGLLVRLQQDINFSGSTESNTAVISWDSNKKIKEYSITGKALGQSVSLRYRFARTTDGKLTKVIEDNYPAISNVDSVVRYVYYHPGTSKLSYMVSTTYSPVIGQVGDSTVFSYDANGRVSSKLAYYVMAGFSLETSKEEFGYDTKGNLTSQKIYVTTGVSFQLTSALNYTYSTHKTPMQWAEEAFVVAMPTTVSPNYTATFTQTTNGTVTLSNDYTKGTTTYNSSDQPVKGTMYMGTNPTTFTCTYQ